MKNRILFTSAAVFIRLCANAQTPIDRLQELTGTWTVIESSFNDPPEGTVIVTSIAEGRGIYSSWKQGADDTYYEANAMWGYSESTNQVQVFEVNTLGVVDTHIGYFDNSNALILELRDPNTNNLLQERSMTWSNNTWKMSTRFINGGKEINHYATLVRQTDEVDLARKEKEIREIWTEMSEYGMKGDWDTYSKYFVQTGRFQMIHPGIGEWLNGWNEFSEKYEDMMRRGMKYSIVKNDISINVGSGGDLAWGLVDFVFYFDAEPNNKLHMWESVVFEKIDGDWKIAMGMASNVGDQ